MCGGMFGCGMGMMPVIDVVPGELVILKRGEGKPRTRFDRLVVVWKIYGGSALCTDGTQLMCLSKFEKTSVVIQQEQLKIMVSDSATAKATAANNRERKNFLGMGFSTEEIEELLSGEGETEDSPMVTTEEDESSEDTTYH